jgi:hypothetical protein
VSKPLTIKHRERPMGRFVVDVWDRYSKKEVQACLVEYDDWQEPSIIRVVIKESPHD